MGIAALAWLIPRSRRFTLLATFLFALDGLFLVDARLALTNTSLVLFGVWAHVAFFVSPRITGWRRWPLLALAGVLFGASFACKWNGLGFVAGAVLSWGVGWLTRIARSHRLLKGSPVEGAGPTEERGPIERLGDLSLPSVALCLVVLPLLTYRAVWEPHLEMYPKGRTFWEWQKAMLDSHTATGGNEAHGYCSKWYTWPFLLRPVAYYYVTDKQPAAKAGDPEVTIVKDIHAIANPVVCWLSTVAMLGILGTGAWTWGSSYVRWLWARPPPARELPAWAWAGITLAVLVLTIGGLLVAALKQGPSVLMGLLAVCVGLFGLGTLIALLLRSRQRPAPKTTGKRKSAPAGPGLVASACDFWNEVVAPAEPDAWLAAFLSGNYVANTLPWIGVKRCLFLYHYMEAYVFAILALAFMLPKWCESLNVYELGRVKGVPIGAGDAVFWLVVGVTLGAFVYWLPIFIGLPITYDAFYHRMLLMSWI